MNRRICATFFFCYGQNKIVVDGDELYLVNSLNEKTVFLDSIHRGSQNRHALWITYDRRPGVDPWIQEMKDKSKRYSKETFVSYWKQKGITILGVLTTYDDCQCAKTKSGDSPDMYLIHFKTSPEDWAKMREAYPDIGDYVKERNH